MAPCLKPVRYSPNVKGVCLALLVGYCGLIFYLSHQSALPTPVLFAHQDKVIHVIAYAVLGFFALAYFTQVIKNEQRALIVAFIFSALYAASDEWHQSFISGRESDLYDWFADILGAGLSLLIVTRWCFFKVKPNGRNP
ncbi:VanZ like family protein [Cycloclasticus pugetii]|nr:VanZ like family protein [Cycloclasticus pugetii]